MLKIHEYKSEGNRVNQKIYNESSIYSNVQPTQGPNFLFTS